MTFFALLFNVHTNIEVLFCMPHAVVCIIPKHMLRETPE